MISAHKLYALYIKYIGENIGKQLSKRSLIDYLGAGMRNNNTGLSAKQMRQLAMIFDTCDEEWHE